MAEKLIDSLTRRFDPAAYRDEYREELLAMIERKAEGKELVEAPEGEEREPTKAPDLMAALEESIAAVGRTGSKAGKAGREERPGQRPRKARRRRKRDRHRAPNRNPPNSRWAPSARWRSRGGS